MKIHGVKLENFMLFDKLDAEFSPNVNIICGENSTGKTACSGCRKRKGGEDPRCIPGKAEGI